MLNGHTWTRAHGHGPERLLGAGAQHVVARGGRDRSWCQRQHGLWRRQGCLHICSCQALPAAPLTPADHRFGARLVCKISHSISNHDSFSSLLPCDACDSGPSSDIALRSLLSCHQPATLEGGAVIRVPLFIVSCVLLCVGLFRTKYRYTQTSPFYFLWVHASISARRSAVTMLHWDIAVLCYDWLVVTIHFCCFHYIHDRFCRVITGCSRSSSSE